MNSAQAPQEASQETTTSVVVVKEAPVTEESVATQVSVEEDVEMNPTSNNESSSDSKNNDESGSNPLFKLVNAAASMIMEPSKEDKETEEQSYHKKEEEEKEQEEDEVMTAETSEKPNSLVTNQEAATSTNAKPIETTANAAADSADKQTSSKPSSPASKPKSPPPNVIQGTKEDLMLDPKVKISFAEHLYNVLENPEHHDVLNWMPDGLSFTVVNHKKFVLQKMPNLFQIRNMSSFVRKLGRWGFSRVFEKETNNSDVFKHPHFHRGDRIGVRKHVKCLGRAAGPKAAAQQRKVARQPDFVVCQEPGKPPMVLPTGNAAPNPLHQAALEQHFMKPRSLSATGGFTSASMGLPLMGGAGAGFGVGGLDEVTNASAASAEALYFSHQQSQKVKMEQLASSDQQRLEDLEIERLMKRRELRQQQKMQQRMFLEQHQQRRYLMEQQQDSLGGSYRGMSGFGGMDTSGSSAHMDASQRSSNMLMQQYQGMKSSTGMTHFPTHHDLRRVSMQHAAGSLDGSLGRSASSRYSSTLNDLPAPPQVTPTYENRNVLGVAYETLQRDEMRSRERQAAIRALLAEEQEFEARRARGMSGGSPAAGFGATNMRG
eukprot:scaffold24048_cov194-Amphora_coffeaeformis.AAC.11